MLCVKGKHPVVLSLNKKHQQTTREWQQVTSSDRCKFRMHGGVHNTSFLLGLFFVFFNERLGRYFSKC